MLPSRSLEELSNSNLSLPDFSKEFLESFLERFHRDFLNKRHLHVGFTLMPYNHLVGSYTELKQRLVERRFVGEFMTEKEKKLYAQLHELSTSFDQEDAEFLRELEGYRH